MFPTEFKPPGKILGTLREPLIQPLPGRDGKLIIYHWETDDKRHTFLYLTISKRSDREFAIARANIDSEEVKGQGDALWAFLTARIQEYSNKGLTGDSPTSIIHEVNTNEYSKRLPRSDPRYVASNDKTKFHGLYLPELPKNLNQRGL